MIRWLSKLTMSTLPISAAKCAFLLSCPLNCAILSIQNKPSMANHIVCIASEHKGNEFLETARDAGWRVTLVTRKKLLDSPWTWSAIDDVKQVEDSALPVDYVLAVTNRGGARRMDGVVGVYACVLLTCALR